MTTTVYHIQRGTANTISYLHRSIEDSSFYGEHKAEIEKTSRIVRMERNKHHRRGSMPGLHLYARGDTSKTVGFQFYGISERQKFAAHPRKAWQLEIQEWKQSVLVWRLLVDTVGKNAKKIQEYIQNQIKEEKIHDLMTLREFENPFMGSK